ncbi:hypothetical protein BH09GEM1_BH09GEM1_21770 [soil metagenome]
MSAFSIAPYFPFPRIVPVGQRLTTNALGVVHSQITFEADPRRWPGVRRVRAGVHKHRDAPRDGSLPGRGVQLHPISRTS